MAPRDLLVETRGGLCNRVRVVLSATVLATQTERRLLIAWHPNEQCGARWADLFTNPIDEIAALPSDHPAHDGLDKLALRAAIESADPIVCVRSSQFLLARGERQLARSFNQWNPVPAIRDRVASVVPSLADHTLGVHVRRQDFSSYLPRRWDRRLPPLARYFHHLDDWSRRYFLATDGGEEVEAAFRGRYGERLITYAKRSVRRREVEAVQDALVDIYLLQRCSGFVGTMHSSFTELGSLYCTAPVFVEEAPPDDPP